MSVEPIAVLPDTIAEQLRASILNQTDAPGSTITEAAVALLERHAAGLSAVLLTL